jgi:serine/threonine-protein kinase
MNDCPALEFLQRFLDGLIPDQVQQEIVNHLETCSACQATLDRLAAGSGHRGADFDDTVTGPSPGSPVGNAVRSGIEFPSPPTERGPLGRLGIYHIQKELGQGSFGVVFQAWEEGLERDVALKVLHPRWARFLAVRERFQREARAAAQIDNDHVIVTHTVHDEAPGFPLPHIVMGFVHDISLREVLTVNPRGLKPEDAVRLVQQAARGLAAAHGRGIVHRDIKPENMLLEQQQSGLRLRITDFGIAQVVEEAEKGSPSGSIIGTPGYMSPEAFLAPEAVDGRSDIYSPGVVLYQFLTGRLPFAGRNLAQVQHQVVDRQFDPPRQLNPKVPRDLQRITPA